MSYFTIHTEGQPPFVAFMDGRDGWALDRLIKAGAEGCTPIAEPAPRWPAYVFNLRKAGIAIETRHEPHAGPFSGHHARYVLTSRVVKGGAQ